MLNRTAQRGEGKAGCIFWLALLALFGIIAWQAVPAKINSSDLADFMVRQAESAGPTPEAGIKKAILSRAQELGLPVTKDNLTVEKTNKRVIIRCEYEIPISIVAYTYQWKISHNVDRPYFEF